ncbi:PH domain-containing protein [Paenibacillus piri]|uniref:PH domain-containing protein n=1 Tax=Paenibacillus piri TaxID=2547395 RepID=A0A4R5KRH9_9BACL|nr:PH domain-containing protein [Paenibacillus piri]TDF98361.1 PH domain-containing protein [Paenibacillus piri]
MGLFDAIMGNASEVKIEEVQAEFSNLLGDSERIERAYKLIRDLFIFTNKRLILVDKQGITGKKIEYHSYPYKSISHFSIETAGHFDLDAELKIWTSGSSTPVQKQFNRQLNIYEIQKILSEYILK